MSMPEQLDWLGEASLKRTVTHAPTRYDKPLARATDPDTSHAAADRVAEFGGEHAAAIFAWLVKHPAGGTKDEIGKGTGLDATAVARRMARLCEKAGVYDSGERRETPAGRASIVWKVRT